MTPSTSTLHWSVIECIVFVCTNVSIRVRSSSFQDSVLRSALGGWLASMYSSTRLVIVSPSTVSRIWSAITIPAAVANQGTDYASTSKGDCVEGLLNSSFHHVRDSCQRVCNLGFYFIGGHLLQCSGDQVFFLFWSGRRFHSLLLSSLKITICVINTCCGSGSFPKQFWTWLPFTLLIVPCTS